MIQNNISIYIAQSNWIYNPIHIAVNSVNNFKVTKCNHNNVCRLQYTLLQHIVRVACTKKTVNNYATYR